MLTNRQINVRESNTSQAEAITERTRPHSLLIHNSEPQSHQEGTHIKAWKQSEIRIWHAGRADFLQKAWIQ